MTATAITLDAARQRYSLIDGGVEAYLTYEYPRAGVRNITHTIVPDVIGGRGHGKVLVRRAVEDAIAAGERLEASCWYAREQFANHPEWAAHLA